MTWSPLACGVITGKYENGIPESSRASMKVGARAHVRLVPGPFGRLCSRTRVGVGRVATATTAHRSVGQAHWP